MDVKGCAAVLLFHGLMAIPVHNAFSNSPCSILNEPLSNKTNNFILLVNPEFIFVNHTYTVTLSGNGNATVILQALSSSDTSGSVVGQWPNTTENCDGSPLFQNLNENGSVSANWTSPDIVQSVVISVYFKEGGDLFRKEVQLDAAPNTTGSTTLTTGKPDTTAPNTTGSTTLTTGKPDTTAPQITTTIMKTTSASSVIHPSSLIMALTETIGFILITSKFLS